MKSVASFVPDRTTGSPATNFKVARETDRIKVPRTSNRRFRLKSLCNGSRDVKQNHANRECNHAANPQRSGRHLPRILHHSEHLFGKKSIKNALSDQRAAEDNQKQFQHVKRLCAYSTGRLFVPAAELDPPCWSPKYRKKSESGEITRLAPLENPASYACIDR